jgi:hypothetical protein
MARFYSNENFPWPAIEELRRLGHDVLTIQETGKAGQSTPDHQVLDFSIAEERILLTLNRKHFIQLHRQRPDHTGIIVCSFDPDFVALARRVHAAVTEQPGFSNQLVRVNRQNQS